MGATQRSGTRRWWGSRGRESDRQRDRERWRGREHNKPSPELSIFVPPFSSHYLSLLSVHCRLPCRLWSFIYIYIYIYMILSYTKCPSLSVSASSIFICPCALLFPSLSLHLPTQHSTGYLLFHTLLYNLLIVVLVVTPLADCAIKCVSDNYGSQDV